MLSHSQIELLDKLKIDNSVNFYTEGTMSGTGGGKRASGGDSPPGPPEKKSKKEEKTTTTLIEPIRIGGVASTVSLLIKMSLTQVSVSIGFIFQSTLFCPLIITGRD